MARTSRRYGTTPRAQAQVITNRSRFLIQRPGSQRQVLVTAPELRTKLRSPHARPWLADARVQRAPTPGESPRFGPVMEIDELEALLLQRK